MLQAPRDSDGAIPRVLEVVGGPEEEVGGRAELVLLLVSREDQPFGQAIDDFVENLRKLTDECLDD